MKLAEVRRPAGGKPGGACGCRGRTVVLYNRPGPFVNHLFFTFRSRGGDREMEGERGEGWRIRGFRRSARW